MIESAIIKIVALGHFFGSNPRSPTPLVTTSLITSGMPNLGQFLAK